MSERNPILQNSDMTQTSASKSSSSSSMFMFLLVIIALGAIGVMTWALLDRKKLKTKLSNSACGSTADPNKVPATINQNRSEGGSMMQALNSVTDRIAEDLGNKINSEMARQAAEAPPAHPQLVSGASGVAEESDESNELDESDPDAVANRISVLLKEAGSGSMKAAAEIERILSKSKSGRNGSGLVSGASGSAKVVGRRTGNGMSVGSLRAVMTEEEMEEMATYADDRAKMGDRYMDLSAEDAFSQRRIASMVEEFSELFDEQTAKKLVSGASALRGRVKDELRSRAISMIPEPTAITADDSETKHSYRVQYTRPGL